MFLLRLLCRWFPSLRIVWVAMGWMLLLMAALVWFVCFPLTAYTLYVSNEFPLAYFGLFNASDPGFNYWIPDDMRKPLGGVCVAFSLYGMFVFYFNTRNLLRLQRGEKPKSRWADEDAALGITPEFDKRDGKE
jgi:glycerol-3-phosphate acyltransferase PlsY